MYYLDKILNIIFTTPKFDENEKGRYLDYTYDKIERYKLYRLFVRHRFGYKFIWFVSVYRLYFNVSYDSFFDFH